MFLIGVLKVEYGDVQPSMLITNVCAEKSTQRAVLTLIWQNNIWSRGGNQGQRKEGAEHSTEG